MSNSLFVASLAVFFAAIFYWGFKRLPTEGWQVMASVPLKRDVDGSWSGRNLTYYGFFNATACTFSLALFLLLMGTINVRLPAAVAIVSLLLIICVPAARIVARIVEGKRHTFTVSGASFVGLLSLPWLVVLFNSTIARALTATVPLIQVLGAAAIAYAFGEAFGRLACISFGCCYGKPIRLISTPLRQRLSRFSFVFTGETKKAAYEGELSGIPLIPIQAITGILSSIAGLLGLSFFLNARWSQALLIPIAATQIWRVLSELLRADYRGGGRVSVYQVMALFQFVYVLSLPLIFEPAGLPLPNVLNGLRSLSNLTALVVIEAVWIGTFLYLGRSSVTSARLNFQVVRDKI